MAFISEIHYRPSDHSDMVVPDYIEVSLHPDDVERLSDFQVATYHQDGSQAEVLGLNGIAPDVDPNTDWFTFLLPVPTTDEDAPAVAFTDYGSDEPILSFISTLGASIQALNGIASGGRAEVIAPAEGNSIQFDVYGNRVDGDAGAASGLVCLTAGTYLDTPDGPRLIEDLKVGDLVTTFDNDAQPIRMIHTRKLDGSDFRNNRKLWPVCVQVGALGFGVPQRKLFVSQQQRMLYQSIRIPLMFSDEAVFVRGKSLAASFEEIYVDSSLAEVTYFHLVFDRHEIIFAEGAPTESFHPGPEGIANLDPAARAELFTLFPDLRFGGDSHRSDYQTIRSWELKAVVS